MASISCLGTFREEGALTIHSSADHHSLPAETTTNNAVALEPVLCSLPIEGYRILDTESSLSGQAHEMVDSNRSNVFFMPFEFDNENAASLKNMFKWGCVCLARNWSIVLLVFVPVGIITPEIGCSDSTVFIINCIAITALTDLLCRATDAIASYLGKITGALLNITMGNAAEFVILHTLLQRQYMIARTSLLGSIIVNMLLVLGLSILTGEAQQRGQIYDVYATRIAAGLFCLTTVSMLMPSTIAIATADQPQRPRILALSRGICMVLILIYALYLWTQLKSNRAPYKSLIELDEDIHSELEVEGPRAHPPGSSYSKFSAVIDVAKNRLWVQRVLPIVMLVISTALISFCGELLVGAIDRFVEQSSVSKTTVGLILLPVVGNAAELISGIMFAWRRQMDLAFAVSIGSAIQIGLFVVPLVVLIGWAMGREMDLSFTVFEAITLIASTVLFSSLVLDGRCSSLKGASLLAGFTVIGLASCFTTI